MKKDESVGQNENEEIVDARENAVVAMSQDTAVAQVPVSGVRLDFPFIRLGQGMSQWKSDGKKPVPGCWYLRRGKDNNVLIAGAGKAEGIYGIVLQKVEGFKEDRKWQAGISAPRRWVAVGTKPDGTAVTEADALEAAAKAGFSLAPRPTGEVWADSGRPKLRANLSRFCDLYMLVPLPEDFDSDEFRVYPIGDRLYTTACYEFDRQYYKQMTAVLDNIKARASFANRHNKGYTWSVNGLAVHVYSSEATNRDGIEYISCNFEKALRDGKPWEFTAEEKADFAKFLLSAKDTTASIDEVSEEF